MAVPGKSAGIFDLAGPIVFHRNERHVGPHQTSDDVGIFPAPFIVVTFPGIGAGAIVAGRQRLDASFRAPFPFDQVAHIGERLPTHLSNDCALVADQHEVLK